jgi:hypothetical protein
LDGNAAVVTQLRKDLGYETGEVKNLVAVPPGNIAQEKTWYTLKFDLPRFMKYCESYMQTVISSRS